VIASKNALGIDVEAVDWSIRALEIARHVFAPEELKTLQDCSIEERPPRFFELWTLKEAFLKARGTGLAGMSRCASFVVQGQHVSVRQPSPLGSDQWTFQLMNLEATYKLAIAIGSPARQQPPARVTKADPFAVMNGVLVPSCS
jgi:4'-phosphopantetheinyl transferase